MQNVPILELEMHSKLKNEALGEKWQAVLNNHIF